MRIKIFRLFLLFLPLTGFVACRPERASNSATAPSEDRPEWLTALIREQQEKPVANPPAEIVRYRSSASPSIT